MEPEMKKRKRFFSIELRSKTSLENVTMTDEPQENVLIEGTIGKLVQAIFFENSILEIAGEEGTIRINLQKKELKREPNNTGTLQNLNVEVEQSNQKRSRR